MDKQQIVLLHGFTQNGDVYDDFKEKLSGTCRVFTPHLPGHGGEPPLQPGLGSKEVALRLSGVYGRSIYMGYSMGARTALRVALEHRESVAGLILVSATAGISDDEERRKRHLDDMALAEHIKATPLKDFLREWLSGPLFANLNQDEAALEKRLHNNPNDMADILLTLGLGAEEPMWSLLPELGSSSIPVLILVGANDEKYLKIGHQLRLGIGESAELKVIDDCGHFVIGERPEEVIKLITPFIAKCR